MRRNSTNSRRRRRDHLRAAYMNGALIYPFLMPSTERMMINNGIIEILIDKLR